jgi:hypothetical protein
VLPCDSEGNFLPPGSPPLPQVTPLQSDWTPFNSEVQFRLAELLYSCAVVSSVNVNTLLELWADSLSEAGIPAPFENQKHMHAAIDASTLGDVPWKCLVGEISGDVDDCTPQWKRTTYNIWYHDPDAVVTNMLSNPDFARQFDLWAYIDLNPQGECRLGNFMSGNIAWQHSVRVQHSHLSPHPN